MQRVSNRKLKIPRSQMSRVGPITLDNKKNVFSEKFGVLTTLTMNFAVF